MTREQNISISGYGKYEGENYGKNCLRVDIGDLILYFSYATVIAFQTPETGFMASENDWGPTTGKHIKWAESEWGASKKERIPTGKFDEYLNATLSNMGLSVKIR